MMPYISHINCGQVLLKLKATNGHMLQLYLVTSADLEIAKYGNLKRVDIV